jgi:hypothetical protein
MIYTPSEGKTVLRIMKYSWSGKLLVAPVSNFSRDFSFFISLGFRSYIEIKMSFIPEHTEHFQKFFTSNLMWDRITTCRTSTRESSKWGVKEGSSCTFQLKFYFLSIAIWSCHTQLNKSQVIRSCSTNNVW